MTLFKEYYDVFAWTYDDFKEYYKSIFQYIIPLKEGTQPIIQKLRIVNPKLKTLVKNELEKLNEDRIIFLIRHS
jgi:hypothetical protein